MALCNRCGEYFNKEYFDCPNNPMEVLGNLMIKSMEREDPSDICPKCKKEMGILTSLGFEK
jgi:hypothetical protein